MFLPANRLPSRDHEGRRTISSSSQATGATTRSRADAAARRPDHAAYVGVVPSASDSFPFRSGDKKSDTVATFETAANADAYLLLS
jgi:hypothetical protein